MFIALAGLFWNVNTGFSRVHERIDRLQVEMNRRFNVLLETIMSFDRRVSRNEGQIEVIREELQAEDVP